MKNPFEDLMNDTVFVESKDGSRTGPFKTLIESKNGHFANIFHPGLDVEEGWKLIRPLPSGKEEVFTILEVNYRSGLDTFSAHWRLKLSKDSSIVGSITSAPQNTTINITNSQGIQIGDHNVQHIADSLIGLVEKIESSNASPHEKVTAKVLLRELMVNPAVAAVLGGATSGVLALLG